MLELKLIEVGSFYFFLFLNHPVMSDGGSPQEVFPDSFFDDFFDSIGLTSCGPNRIPNSSIHLDVSGTVIKIARESPQFLFFL